MTMGRHILCRALTRLPCFELQPMIIALHCTGQFHSMRPEAEIPGFLLQCDNADLRDSSPEPEPTPVSAPEATGFRQQP
jgi:hypothetical protein